MISSAANELAPKGLWVTPRSTASSPGSSEIGRPDSASQTRALLSALAVTMRRPSGLYIARQMPEVVDVFTVADELRDQASGVCIPNPSRPVCAYSDNSTTIGAIYSPEEQHLHLLA